MKLISKLSLSLATLSLCAVACQKDVQPKPTADFTYSIVSSSNVEKVFQFTNTSKNANRYQWTTQTGIATSDKDISLRATDNGRYIVSLTAKNDIGEDTKTQNIDVSDLATTGDFIFWTQLSNTGDITISVNNTTQGKITQRVTNGIKPNCGFQGFVTVTLAPGTYNYMATTSGLLSLKWNGTFTVVRGQCSSLELIK